MWSPLLKAFRALRPRRKTVTAVERLFGGIPLSQLRNYESYLQAASNKVWAAWKACDICANAVSNTHFILQRGKKPDAVEVPELAELFEFANQFQTFRELVYLTVFWVKATGNAYWYKSEATLAGERPRELFPLNPKRVQVVTDEKTGDPVGYLYTGQHGVRIPFDLEDVLHFKRPHPNNDYYGLGDIEAAEDLFNEHINRSKWTEGFWKNGAAPSGVMYCKNTVESDDEWEEVKAMFRKEYAGAANSGKTALLTGEWDYQQLGLSSAEMQSIESSKWTIEQIFMVHGVPLSVAGVRDAANYATADIDNQRFKEYTIQPLVLLIQDTVNTDLIAGWGDDLVMTFNITGLVNMGKVVLELAPAFDRGWVSINECRERMGLSRDEDNEEWNQHFMSAGLVPVEMAGISANGGITDEASKRTIQRFIENQMKGPNATETVQPSKP